MGMHNWDVQCALVCISTEKWCSQSTSKLFNKFYSLPYFIFRQKSALYRAVLEMLCWWWTLLLFTMRKFLRSLVLHWCTTQWYNKRKMRYIHKCRTFYALNDELISLYPVHSRIGMRVCCLSYLLHLQAILSESLVILLFSYFTLAWF